MDTNSPALTLDKKQAMLRDTVAFPTAKNWALLCSPAKAELLVGELNEVLRVTLQEFIAGRYSMLGEMGDALFARVNEIHVANPDAGITDSESFVAIARFFAVNYEPAYYDFFRYLGCRE